MKKGEVQPEVTVLMPVFNGEAFLDQAIESILAQSFTDFEFLIVNDGSGCATQAILERYAASDRRIRVIHNETNLGLTRSLNRGLDLAQGRYLARMDGDDVSLPERLARQVELLDRSPDIAFTSVKMLRVDAGGAPLGYWDDDMNSTSHDEIYRILPRRNCIVHPGIMIRTDLLRRFRYNEKLKVSQDYDLWLRLCACGHRVEKVDEVLLHYRVTEGTITSRIFATRYWSNQANLKWRFLLWAVSGGHLGRFTGMAALSFGYVLIKLLLSRLGIRGRFRPPAQSIRSSVPS